MEATLAVSVTTRMERDSAITTLLVSIGRWGSSVALATLLTLSLISLGEGAPGDLDPTFGVGGKVLTDFGGDLPFDFAHTAILQPDGKIVAAGTAHNDFALARYLPDGSLDPTFGIGGKVTTNFGTGDNVTAIAGGLVRQSDGKLVAAGTFGNEFEFLDFALARYLPTGELDPTFGDAGKVITDFGGLDGAGALILQPDGKLVAAGVSDSNIALARYLPDGSLDPDFGVGGKVTVPFGQPFGVTDLVLQPDGKLVTAGSSDGNFALTRHLPNGDLDPSFGIGGFVTTDFQGLAFAIVLQPDGKLVVAGFSSVAGTQDFALARYLADGSPDVGFGTNGRVTTDFSGGGDTANALILQPDGKLVAAGSSHRPGALIDFALARYLPGGSLDSTFGIDGKVTTSFGGAGSTDTANALVLQPDGKLVAVGAAEPAGPADFALARYDGLVPGIGPPTNKEECKNNGWRRFTVPRAFKNEGDCIQFVTTGR